jgi:DHA1 family bicyclomycin/chloramphenicol resistance-like MFS transporter
MVSSTSAPRQSRAEIGLTEFVCVIAAMMAIHPLSMDAMLPALSAIGADLHLQSGNHRQWIVSAYLLGFGVSQLFYGVLADRWGRRPILMGALIIYALLSVAAACATSAAAMIVIRALQGLATGAPRVLAVSVIRDRYQGRLMARTLSLAYMTFMVVPIIAPSIGQAILLVGSWRAIFLSFTLFGAATCLWVARRLPETLDPARRRAINLRNVVQGSRIVTTDRYSAGYTLALALLLGALYGFIVSLQQIFIDIYEAPHAFGTVVPVIGGTIILGSFINSRIVVRLGTRRVAHSVLCLLLLVQGAHLARLLVGPESLVSFTLFQAASMACLSLCGANFGAIAMENMGGVAGLASSFQGFFTTIVGSLIGLAIGQQFDRSTIPLVAAFVILGLAALAIVFATERGRLFQPHAFRKSADAKPPDRLT